MSSSSRPHSAGSSSSSSSASSQSPHTHHEDPTHRAIPSAEASSSSSASSSSTRLPNPSALLPPLTPPGSTPSGGKAGGPILANELLDPEVHAHHSHHSTIARNPVPEKCLTFCSQSQDNQAICRMFCLRRRRPVTPQAEQLARLRPASMSKTEDKNTDSGSWGTGGWNPFKALERRAAPWSFIYVKGSPEGVVGRYMEELQQDDGNRDFGGISRGASDLQRRRGPGGMEYIDWDEHGSVHPPSIC